MKLELPYGETPLRVDMDWGRCLGVLDVADAPELPDVGQTVRDALAHPIGLDRGLHETIRPGETVAILVSDAFRKTGIDRVLPTLIEGLNRAGVADEAVQFVFACGTHRPPTDEEQARILGRAVHERFRGRVSVHDPEDEANLTYVATTSRGTPVAVNKRVRDCDRIIATGTVVLHYFAGYGGGRKSILPGISGADTIAHNHTMNVDPSEDRLNPAVRIGALDGNPVSEDMLEAARLVGVDYTVCTVLNREARIAGLFAGELDAAHRAAAAFARGLYTVSIAERADLVIASSGAAGNFVQSHKALYNAYQALRPGGRIVLLAQCPEGAGNERFLQWAGLGSAEAIINGLRKHGDIYGQTALSTVEKGPSCVMVTEMADDIVAVLKATKAASLENALHRVREDLVANGVADPAYYAMPSAGYTVPLVEP